MKKNRASIVAMFTLVLFFSVSVFSQTPEFTYQGSLQNGGTAASGNYDFEFLLFDASAGGTQIGSTLTRNGVAVANGIFAVNLDFGASFPGASRYLEMHVRPMGGGAFTTLMPRQPLTSAPYAVKSLTSDTAVTAINATNAANAMNFSGSLSGDVNGTQNATAVTRLQGRSLAATPPIDGQVIKFNSATGQWEPGADNIGAAGGGTITGVTPGTGLTGGGASGNPND